MEFFSSLTNIALAQEGEGGGGLTAIFGSPIMMFAIMFGIIYLMLIRPQQKQQKKHREMIEALKRGDRVITQSGIFGKIASIDGNVITLEIDHKVNIRILKNNIAGLEMPDAAKKEESASEAPKDK